jgi:rhodanese-related sulfurtransferase
MLCGNHRYHVVTRAGGIMNTRGAVPLLMGLLALGTVVQPIRVAAQEQPNTRATIFHARLGETDARTPEISTEELKVLLASGPVLLLDTRPHREWAISHIPGAKNVAPKPGMPMSQYTSDVAEVERLVVGDKTRPLVLYCNGPFCGKSKRVSDDLIAAGHTNVRRYQLGAPVWRALGGVMVTELDGMRHILEKDRTAVFVDAREPTEFAMGSLHGAQNLPRGKVLPGKDVGEVKAAKDDGRLPMEDHNTRIVVFGQNAEQARAVAEAIAQEAFHNVSYFDGSFDALQGLMRK